MNPFRYDVESITMGRQVGKHFDIMIVIAIEITSVIVIAIELAIVFVIVIAI